MEPLGPVEGKAAEVPSIKVHVHLHGRVVTVSCGTGQQRLAWLAEVGPILSTAPPTLALCSDSWLRLALLFAQVAIARWDEEEGRGWLYLGAPKGPVVKEDDTKLQYGQMVKDVLKDGESVTFQTLHSPQDTKAS
eukprot:scaffold873_cov252-Pinguiococcus_pyrenoidosus.AAC.17